jgi:hypothetical protein
LNEAAKQNVVFNVEAMDSGLQLPAQRSVAKHNKLPVLASPSRRVAFVCQPIQELGKRFDKATQILFRNESTRCEEIVVRELGPKSWVCASASNLDCVGREVVIVNHIVTGKYAISRHAEPYKVVSVSAASNERSTKIAQKSTFDEFPIADSWSIKRVTLGHANCRNIVAATPSKRN